MTFGPVHASHSLPKGQAVMLPFFAPCLNHQIRLFSVSFHYKSMKAVQHDRNELEHLPSRFCSFEINFL